MTNAGLFFALLGLGCGGGKADDDGIDSDSDADTDTDTGSDTGTGSDTETAYDCEYDCAGKWGEACCADPYGYGMGYPDCTDLLVDDYNCGACGVVCDENEDRWCSEGECACVWEECDGVCVTFATDPDHCGACDTVCPPAERACDEGSCAPCEQIGEVLCGADCADVAVDDANCGTCGNRCRARAVCSAGACVEGTCAEACHDRTICCASPWGGGKAGCTDPSSDVHNCGGCDVACPALNFCDEGTCRCGSPFGGVDDPIRDCDETCVDTRVDAANCGACGVTCPAACVDGACE